MHSIALVASTEAREGCFPKILLPSSGVSNAIVPIVKRALATGVDAFRYADHSNCMILIVISS